MKKPLLLIGVILLVVVACRSVGVKPAPELLEQSQDAHGRNPAQYYGNQVKLEANEYLTYSKFIDLISPSPVTGRRQPYRVRTIAEAIDKISDAYPEYMKFNTLMYESGSAQGSSFTEPRVIVHGPDARFIFTFNGNASQVGGNVIEILSFNDATANFELREIIFKSERPNQIEHSTLMDGEIDFETDELIVSKKDPATCMECHGVNTTPIWDAYFVWPGAYGSDDDLLFDDPDPMNNHMAHGGPTMSYGKPKNWDYLNQLQYPRSLGRVFNIKDGVLDVEAQGYKDFVAGKKNHPRYHRLADNPLVFFPLYDEKGQLKGSYRNINSYPAKNFYLSEQLSILLDLSLSSLVKKLNLVKKWSDIRWPVHPCWKNPSTCPGYVVQDLPEFNIDRFSRNFEEGFGIDRTARLQRKFGPLRDFVAEKMLQELRYTVKRIHRMEEKTFGNSSLEFTKYHAPRRRHFTDLTGEWSVATENVYTQLLGRPLNHYEKMALQVESDDIAINAVIAYLLKDENVNLEDYSPAIARKPIERIPTFTIGPNISSLKKLMGLTY